MVRKDIRAETKQHLTNVLQAHGVGRENIAPALNAISLALAMYRAAKDHEGTCRPAAVRARFSKLLNTAERLDEQLSGLDDLGRELLAESVKQLNEGPLGPKILVIVEALSLAREQALPSAKLVDYVRRELAIRVAQITEQVIGKRPTSTRNSVYNELLGAVLHEATGREPRETHELARAALTEIKNRRAEGDYREVQWLPPSRTK